MKFKLNKLDRRWRWVGLGILAIIIRIIFSFTPWLCEVLYSRGLFLVIRWTVDNTIARLPFATVYLAIFGLLVWIGFTIQRIIRTLRTKFDKDSTLTWKKIVGSACLSFISFLGMVVFLFLFMWGYNYARIPLETQIKLETPALDYKAIKAEAHYIMETCKSTRELIPNADTNALTADFYPEDLETTMRDLLVAQLEDMGYPTLGRVRGRELWPNGTLLGFGASGVYIPFTCEGHIERALHPTHKPFTMAHELGHGYGFGDEAVCNFLGYISCVTSKDPAIRYAGHLTYWRYIFTEFRRMDNEGYKELRATISTGMDNDLDSLYAVSDKYPSFFPEIQRSAYNTYLKTQGVSEGVKSYDRMVVLVAAWRKKKEFN